MFSFKVKCFLLCLFIGAVLFFPLCSRAAEETAPVTNHEKKWRIGYYEGGDKPDYVGNLIGLIEGLMELGWIEQAYIPEKKESNHIWQWLSKDIKSKYIEFVGDAYWDSEKDEKKRKENKKSVIDRLAEKKDIDMMIAMGTWAGQDLANDLHSTNTMVMDASNPVQSGICASAENSGRPYIHVMVELDRYRDQIDLFHRIIGFKKLGIVYKDSLDGRSFAAIQDVMAVAEEKKFSVEECVIQADMTQTETVQKIIQCHRDLAPKNNAMYLTSHFGIEKKDMKELMRPLLEYKLPTWSQTGEWEVEYGALMSFNRPDYADVGIFQAKVMAQILRGTPPEKISQIFHNPKNDSISLNLKTAQLIEFNPEWDVISAAEHIYKEIKE